MSELLDGWEVVAIEPGLWCLRRPGYSAEIQASADGDNIDIADDAGRRWLYPPVAAVERLLALRRAALAPEDPLAAGVRSLVAGLDAIRAKALAPGAQASLAPAVASERPGLARLLEWARAKLAEESAEMREYPERGRDAFEECVDEIEQEIAALGPPSIADAPSASVEPEWIVNDIAELGVRLNDRFFYLYKGGNISYEGGHDSGGPMRWRPVYKREFGEVCHPFGFKGLGDAERYELGDGWKDMPDLSTPPSIAEDLRTPEPGAFEGAVLVGSEAARNRRQAEVGEWAFATFGEISYHHGERVTRLLEEAVELAQAEGLDELSAMDVVHRVFEKPAGDWRKDVGAVGVTLLAYCHSRQVSADEREAAEWDRVKAIDPETMRARQNAKAAAGYGLQAVRP